jgi:hypothetical protein
MRESDKQKLIKQLEQFNIRDNKLLDAGEVREDLIPHMVQAISTRKTTIEALKANRIITKESNA